MKMKSEKAEVEKMKNKRFTENRNGKNVIPLRKAVCGIELPHWSIEEESEIQSFLSGEAADRLAEFEDKMEQGTLIELPCKVGDTVYVIYQYRDFLGTEDEPFIEEDIVKLFLYDDNKMKIVPSNYAERSDYWYTAIDILLTREEAEKRLEELKGGK